MRNPHGYGRWDHPDHDGAQLERDTIKCGHCQSLVFVKPGTVNTVYLVHDMRQPGGFREEPGAFCRCCMSPICLRCHEAGVCTPFMAKVEAAEARQRQVDAILGRR